MDGARFIIVFLSVVFLGVFINTRISRLTEKVDDCMEKISAAERVLRQEIYTGLNGWEEDK